jgi:hypothetical protein
VRAVGVRALHGPGLVESGGDVAGGYRVVGELVEPVVDGSADDRAIGAQ